MALSEFLRNLRIGSRLLSPGVQPGQTANAVNGTERQLTHADLWLTPRAIEGFSVDDFPNLLPEQREWLVNSVNEFRTIAENIPSDATAKHTRFQQGLLAFNRILEILGPYIEDPDAEIVLQHLMHLDLPNFVVGTYCETDEDSSGEIEYDIWLIVADDAVKLPDFWDRIDALRELIDEKLRAAKIEKWWHIHVRTASEHLESLVAHE
jgi:hypothetical protein